MQWYAGTNLHRIDLKLNFSHLSNQGPKFISRRLKGHDTMMSVWKKSSMIIVSRQRCIARCLRVAQRILENIREKKKKIRGLTSSLLDEWMAKSKSLNSFPIVVSSVYLKIKRRRRPNFKISGDGQSVVTSVTHLPFIEVPIMCKYTVGINRSFSWQWST